MVLDIGCNNYNRLVLVNSKVVDKIIFCIGGFLLGTLERRDLGYFVGSFEGTVNVVVSTCVGLLVGRIMNSSEIDAIKLNDSSSVSCKEEM